MRFTCLEKLHLLVAAACVGWPSCSLAAVPGQGCPVPGREWLAALPSAGTEHAAASCQLQQPGPVRRNEAWTWWVCLLSCFDTDVCWDNSKIGFFTALLSQECGVCKYSTGVDICELPTARQEHCGGARNLDLLSPAKAAPVFSLIFFLYNFLPWHD